MKTLTARLDRLSAPALAALGIANALFLFAFLIVLMTAAQIRPVHAAESCGGVNILAEMQRDQPEKYRELLAEAQKVAHGGSTLFRIEKPGVETSWLFGTMHLTDPRVTNLPAAAKKAFDEADTIAIEATEILDQAKVQMAMFSKPEITMFTDGRDLSDFLTAEQAAVLKKGLADRGIQYVLVEKMKPWLISAMIALPQCEVERKSNGTPILDMKLALDAEAQGKQLVGLETIVEQFEAIGSIPMDLHVQGLVDTIALGGKLDDVIETMIQLYVDGQPGKIWPMLHVITPETDTGSPSIEAYAEFEEAMVHARNRTMVERSLPLLEQGAAFIAVGALHLPGDQGLATLFEKAGYTVTPVRD
jgi:uncharacterized protein YbaP (TraB family)